VGAVAEFGLLEFGRHEAMQIYSDISRDGWIISALGNLRHASNIFPVELLKIAGSENA
jgi:hypothetical protein